MFDFTTEINLYICETNPTKHTHHGLHQNTAPYVVTTHPTPGDNIVYVLNGGCDQTWALDENNPNSNVSIKSATASLNCYDQSSSSVIKLISHLGRKSLVGEDGAEDAFGNDITEQIFTECLPVFGEKYWSYAPCDIKKVKTPKHITYIDVELDLEGKCWKPQKATDETKSEKFELEV